MRRAEAWGVCARSVTLYREKPVQFSVPGPPVVAPPAEPAVSPSNGIAPSSCASSGVEELLATSFCLIIRIGRGFPAFGFGRATPWTLVGTLWAVHMRSGPRGRTPAASTISLLACGPPLAGAGGWSLGRFDRTVPRFARAFARFALLGLSPVSLCETPAASTI